MAGGMTTEGTVRAVLLDGMGTLLRLVPPAPALARALGVDEATAESAFRAEVAYYVVHHLEGSDPSSLGDLRRRCAAVLAEAAGTDPASALDALMASLRFEPWEDAAPALEQLREHGLRLVVVSNWDCSLPEVLDGIGLGPLVDAVVTSAVVGAAKPDARIFGAALELAGCRPGEAVHVGDSPEDDQRGAIGAGLRGLLLDRGGTPGTGTVTSLSELPSLLS
jgi:HAD superfamily hydrolase (TIGR01549 family)